MSETLGTSLPASRNLFEAGQDADLISSGPRGKGVHLSLAEQINLWLAHNGIEPSTDLATSIPKWRSLPAQIPNEWFAQELQASDRSLRGCCFGEVSIALDQYRDTVFPDLPKVLDHNGRWSGENDPRCYQTLPGATFGEALEKFVDFLSRSEGSVLRAALRKVSWNLKLDSMNVAEVSYAEDGVVFRSYFHASDYTLKKPGIRLISSTFDFVIFDKLADLWADSKSHIAGNVVGLAATKPKRKKAAEGPTSNDLLSSSKQAAKPASLNHTESSLHTPRVLEQPWGRGLPFSLSTGKVEPPWLQRFE